MRIGESVGTGQAHKAIPLVTSTTRNRLRRRRWSPRLVSHDALGGVCPRRRTGGRAAAVPSVSDCGTHRDSEQRRASDPRSSGKRSAERRAERGARVEPLGAGPATSGLARGGLGSPNGLCICWRRDIERATSTQARLGRGSISGLVFSAIAFSSTQNRLAVMCRLIEGGGGHGASILGAAGLHRSYRLPDSPVPDRGERFLETTNEVRQGNYHPGRETWEVDREGNMLNMRALEGDEGRIPEGSLQPENAALFQPAPRHRLLDLDCG